MNERELLKLFSKAKNQTILIAELPKLTKLSEWELRHLINPLLNEKCIYYLDGVTNMHGFTTYSEYKLSNAGIVRLEELNRIENTYHFNETRARVTLGIAVTSLIIAIISIILAVLTYLQG